MCPKSHTFGLNTEYFECLSVYVKVCEKAVYCLGTQNSPRIKCVHPQQMPHQ